LEHDGVARGGEKAHMFSAAEDSADAIAFAKYSVDDSKRGYSSALTDCLGAPE
jgi:hypothetical protein